MKILITGIAGFIGFHVAKRLLETGYNVHGLDNINDYYDINLKYARLQELGIETDNLKDNHNVKSTLYPKLTFSKNSIEDKFSLENIFSKEKFDIVCHLAAQAGVRYSMENPHSYALSNLVGFLNILEACRNNNIKHLAYASSSSVYGLNEKMPLSTEDSVNHPVSLYAATKKSNELMAHSYSHLYNIPTTGMRFFTVYGPWGRPDMSPMLFASAIKSGKPIKIFNEGKMTRDFTYISDIVDGVISILLTPAVSDLAWDPSNPNPESSKAPYRIYNIGHSEPINLMHFIKTIENEMGIESKKEFLPMQPGDVVNTFADVSLLKNNFKYNPSVSVEEGVHLFVEWFNNYYKA